ncbi:DUF982 domain-containing protein [Chelativorans salis]|uniref:DUF982 domain-containing protein n=1 Tax=Chelativorans salis TaxID=2978478 RepID=A0ABT2LKR1_9HYPH|nr:DUF982 domain-containing protein [Chelativorans sp. EGI FJ00035]MCT7374964.1 DUF982 domain-containing protein [Chelativorans sp. EGI FJ00035]
MHLFKTPVVVEPGVLGRFRIVLGPVQALEILTGRWPDKESENYRKAVAACREAAKGRKAPHLARRSFVAAARTAKVLVPPEVSRQYTIGSVDLAAFAVSAAKRRRYRRRGPSGAGSPSRSH